MPETSTERVRRWRERNPPPPRESMQIVLSSEVQEQICERLSEGEPLRTICADPAFPSYSTVNRLRARDAAFGEMVERARLAGIESLAEDIIRIADTERDPNKAKVMIDARKWLAAKLMPRKYGERLELTGDLGSNADVESRLSQLLGKAGIDVADGGAAETSVEEPAGGVLQRRIGVADEAVPAVSEADGVPQPREGS